MRRFWPLITAGVGLLVFFGGFVYDAMFAGIPYQDPTPALSARYAHDADIASVIYSVGFALFALGLLAGIVRWVVRRLRR